jgi:hypothetical protein
MAAPQTRPKLPLGDRPSKHIAILAIVTARALTPAALLARRAGPEPRGPPSNHCALTTGATLGSALPCGRRSSKRSPGSTRSPFRLAGRQFFRTRRSRASPSASSPTAPPSRPESAPAPRRSAPVANGGACRRPKGPVSEAAQPRCLGLDLTERPQGRRGFFVSLRPPRRTSATEATKIDCAVSRAHLMVATSYCFPDTVDSVAEYIS